MNLIVAILIKLNIQVHVNSTSTAQLHMSDFKTLSNLLGQVTRDYDEEEQGYDSEKEAEEEDDDERKSDSDSASSPKALEEAERVEVQLPRKSKLNGDDHHQEDMEMSD